MQSAVARFLSLTFIVIKKIPPDHRNVVIYSKKIMNTSLNNGWNDEHEVHDAFCLINGEDEIMNEIKQIVLLKVIDKSDKETADENHS
jgi:hypothetical protein